jgi:hypothetical protein
MMRYTSSDNQSLNVFDLKNIWTALEQLDATTRKDMRPRSPSKWCEGTKIARRRRRHDEHPAHAKRERVVAAKAFGSR